MRAIHPSKTLQWCGCVAQCAVVFICTPSYSETCIILRPLTWLVLSTYTEKKLIFFPKAQLHRARPNSKECTCSGSTRPNETMTFFDRRFLQCVTHTSEVCIYSQHVKKAGANLTLPAAERGKMIQFLT